MSQDFRLQVFLKNHLPLITAMLAVATVPPLSPTSVVNNDNNIRLPTPSIEIRKFAAGIVNTGGKFATGFNNISETGGKICRRCR